jgi:hypothetical protein
VCWKPGFAPHHALLHLHSDEEEEHEMPPEIAKKRPGINPGIQISSKIMNQNEPRDRLQYSHERKAVVFS